MVTPSPMLPALLLFIAFAAAGAAAETTTALGEVCCFLGGFYVTPELCMSALCADPSTPCRAARDAPAVAVLAARLVAQNATATKASVEDALSSARAGAGNAEVTAGIQSCLELYAGAVPALKWAAASVATGQFRGARAVLQAAFYVPEGCDGMAGDVAALPRVNDEFTYMAMVAHAVVASRIRDY